VATAAVQLAPPFHLATYRTVKCPYMSKGEGSCAAGERWASWESIQCGFHLVLTNARVGGLFSCTYAHSDTELRRPPYDANGKIVYQPRSCTFFPNCRDGVTCDKAHGKEEYLFHPLNYKSPQRHKICRADGNCTVTPRWRCPFLHSDEMEADTEASDPAAQPKAPATASGFRRPGPSSSENHGPLGGPGAGRPEKPRNSLFKTKICPRVTVAEDGEVIDVNGCQFGKKCHFAHSKAELRPAPPVTGAQPRAAVRAMESE